ncbi:hypothetical protein [uncultured Microbacterium sp.]|uniref:hypothetical protein n=1 Tax=uncultured Microbacterium sp. TaxID=191216 RepID=UPI00261496B3|nr:hypothetical protein [uncultured Microbacterium sp.]
MGFFESMLNNGRIEVPGVTAEKLFRATVAAAAECRFSILDANPTAGFIRLRANSEYKHWDGNLSVIITESASGAVATLSGAVEGFSLLGTKTASRGELASAQGKLDGAIRRSISANAPRSSRASGAPAPAPASRQRASTAQFKAAFAVEAGRRRMGLDLPDVVAAEVVADEELLARWLAWWQDAKPHLSGQLLQFSTSEAPAGIREATQTAPLTSTTPPRAQEIRHFRSMLANSSKRREIGLDFTDEYTLGLVTDEVAMERLFAWWSSAKPHVMGLVVRPLDDEAQKSGDRGSQKTVHPPLLE